MKRTRFSVRTWLATTLLAGTIMAAGAVPSLNAGHLAKGPYSSMHMLLEKTILKVDVLTVDIRFGKETQSKFTPLVQGKSYTADLGRQLASVAIQADDAVVQLKFVRDVSLDQWMDGVRENLEQARAAGLISGELKAKVAAALPHTFAALKDRGYKEGDRLLYAVSKGVLDTAVVAANGKILVQKQDKDKKLADVVLASYLAPGSDFRELLLKSLFKS